MSLPPRPMPFPLFLIESPSQNIHLPLTSASTDPAGWNGIGIPEHPYPIPCSFNLAQPLALPGSFGAPGTCYKNLLSLATCQLPCNTFSSPRMGQERHQNLASPQGSITHPSPAGLWLPGQTLGAFPRLTEDRAGPPSWESCGSPLTLLPWAKPQHPQMEE